MVPGTGAAASPSAHACLRGGCSRVTSRPVVYLGPVRGFFCGLDYDAIRAGCATSFAASVRVAMRAMEPSER